MNKTMFINKMHIRIVLFTLLICILPFVQVSSIAERNDVWGELNWHLDDNGTLSITGTGRMNDYNYLMDEGWLKYSKAIRKVIIQQGITNISESAFLQCTQLETLVIPDSVVSIDRSAFDGCVNLQLNNIPGHIKNIGIHAFSDCDSISNLSISEGVEVIDVGAFSNCDMLISVSIPDSVISVGDDIFVYCQNLEKVHVSDRNQVLYTVDSVLFAKDGRLLWYPATKYDSYYVVPSGTITLSYDAFWNCKAQTIEIPESVEFIQGHCFSYSEGLNKVIIKGDKTWIKYAFDDCMNLKELYILGRNNRFGNQYSQEIGLEQYDNTTVYCYKGSTAEAYADSMGLKKVLLDEQANSNEEKITAYVTRCYEIILGRAPDAGGMKTWYNELVSGRKAASEIIDNFVRSQEFLGKNYSNADAVEILYKAMLGRGSDPAGKADWVGKLDAGYPFAVVINGFCGSKEFKEICDSYGIAPGSVSMEQGSASDQQIRAFVTRCYKIILGRDADEVGMNTWFNELKSRRRTAAEIIEQFVYSQEFQNKKYSNPDAVEILYKAMLGRGSDPAGKADWVGRLAGGQPLTAIINGFCGSMEFTAICEAYGITPGSVKVENLSRAAEGPAENAVPKTEKKANLVEITNASDTVNEQLGTAVQAIYINEEKAKEFIGRCYRAILGREAGAEELNGWIGQMTNGSKTADQIARGFLFSGEFKGRNIGNEELVKILYRVYMNREADTEGLATWTQKLDEGTGLNELLDEFAKTNEFKVVLKDMAQ